MSEIRKIAKAIKAKGLQKLKYWCELCHKQCRDENGYRNHCSSDGHLRQMKLFAQNSRSIIDKHSRIFERDFVDLIRRRYRFKTVLINRVYNEFIQDKEHLHMNATRWTSLTGLCLYLGEKGICDINETDRGWEIRYIDRDRSREAQQEEIRRKEKMESDAESRLQKRLMDQYKAYQKIYGDQNEKVDENSVFSEQEHSSIAFKLNPVKKLENRAKKFFEDQDETIAMETGGCEQETNCEGDSDHDQQQVVNDKWLFPNLVVKVINKSVGDGIFYQKKGYILKVEGDYVAHVRMFDQNFRLKIDQSDLETVLPPINGTVLIVNGIYKGRRARLIELDIDNYRAKVGLIPTGDEKEIELYKPYEDICKIYEPS